MAVTPLASDLCELVDDGRMLEDMYQSSGGYDGQKDIDDMRQELILIIEELHRIVDGRDEYEDSNDYEQAALCELDDFMTTVERQKVYCDAEIERLERLKARFRSRSVSPGMCNIDHRINRRQSSRASDSRVEISQKSAESEFSDTVLRKLPLRTLPKDHLRLLCLLGRDKKQQLHCRLDTYHYKEAPTYDALSYCWGDSMDTTIIICNNKALPIRTSLYAALIRFEEGVALPLRPLWIDAICLNQNNDDEKARQIPRMGNIYIRAARTLIWLGEEAENSNIAMRFLGDLYKHNQNGDAAKVAELIALLSTTSPSSIETFTAIIMSVQNGKPAEARKILQPLMEDSNAVTELLDDLEVQLREGSLIRAHFAIADLVRSDNENALVSSLQALASRAWFDRVWVLQELLLSTSPVIVCGTLSIEWAALASSVDTFIELGVAGILDPAGLIEHKKELENRYSVIHLTEAIRKTREENRYHTNTLFYMTTMSIESRQCQEPVDRIWAVVALLSDEFQELIGDSHIVDYTEMGKQQYWKSYLSFMQLLGLPNPLDFWASIIACQGLTKHPHLPSWCQDFNAKGTMIDYYPI